MAGQEGNLCEATRASNLEQVKQLVEQGEQVNQLDKHGETPLIIASCLGYTEVSSEMTPSIIFNLSVTFQIVSVLLGVSDISVNTQTPEGWTALVAAADKGHHGLVRTLLKHRGTDVNIRDNQGNLYSMSWDLQLATLYCGRADNWKLSKKIDF